MAADMAAGIAPAKAIDLMSDNLVMLPESIHVRQEWRGRASMVSAAETVLWESLFFNFFLSGINLSVI